MSDTFSSTSNFQLHKLIEYCAEDYKPAVRLKKLQRSYKSDHPIDYESRAIMNLASFPKAYMRSIEKEDNNVVAVMGPKGRGKTNVCYHYCNSFSKYLNVPFSWSHNLYIGEDVVIHRKAISSRHKRLEHVVIDEAEFLFVSNSKKLRELIHTLASGRDAGHQYWFMFPTPKDVKFYVFDSHGNWVIQCVYRDHKNQKIYYKIFFNAYYLDQFEGGEWIEYPFPGAIYVVPYMNINQYKSYRAIKNRIYDIEVDENYDRARRKLDKELQKHQKEIDMQERVGYLKKTEKIFSSKVSDIDKVIDLINLDPPLPISRIHPRLSLSYNSCNTIIDEYHLKGKVTKRTREKISKKKKGRKK